MTNGLKHQASKLQRSTNVQGGWVVIQLSGDTLQSTAQVTFIGVSRRRHENI